MAGSSSRSFVLGMGAKISILTTSLVLTAIAGASVLSIFETRARVKQEVSGRLLAIVETAVAGLDATRHADIRGDPELGDDVISDGQGGELRLFGAKAFLETRAFLRRVRKENSLATELYTFRWVTPNSPIGASSPHMEFVVMTDEKPYIGHVLTGLSEEQRQAVTRLYATGRATTTDLYRDTEGVWISALAPIMTPEGALDAVLEADYRLDMYHRLVMDRFRKAILFVFIGCAATVALSLAFGRLLTRPLHALAGAMKVMERGELPDHVAVRSNDEIGYLAVRFNSMIDGLRHTIQGVSEHTITLVSASEKMSATSRQLTSGAEELSAQSTHLMSSGEKLSVNINTMASSAKDISSSAGTVATSIEAMSASINEVARSCEKESVIAKKADAQAKRTHDIMAQLGDSAGRIGKVVEMINRIADQTNLLALNATIEAASAGEAGKGFAVVAHEVKELARQSAQATEQIAAQVRDMQVNTDTAVKAIQEISVIIEEVTALSTTIAGAVEEQSATSREIARTMSGVSGTTTELAGHVRQAAMVSDAVATNIQSLNRISSQTAGGATQVNSNARELADIATRLRGLIAQFKTDSVTRNP